MGGENGGVMYNFGRDVQQHESGMTKAFIADELTDGFTKIDTAAT